MLDYNAGNPSGDPATLGDHAAPKVPLVAVYPKEGTLFSDSPYVILDAPWSTADKKAGAQDFLDYLLLPEQQKLFTDAFFRTADGKAGDPITSSSAVKADGVTITLNPPAPEVLSDVRSLWAEVRKTARILVVMDVSGSMSARFRVGRQEQARPRQVRGDHRARPAGRHRSGRFLGVHHRPADARHDHRRAGGRRAAEPDPSADHRRDRRADPAERHPAVRRDQGGRGEDERLVRPQLDQRGGGADRRAQRIHRQRPRTA